MVIKGLPISEGIISGEVYCHTGEVRVEISDHSFTTIENEIRRFQQAQKYSMLEVHKLYEKAMEELDEQSAAIFEMHEMLLGDMGFTGQVIRHITGSSMTAEDAIIKERDSLVDKFRALPDESFRQKADDIIDFTQTLLGHMQGNRIINCEMPEGRFILMVHDITPEEFLRLDLSRITGILSTSTSKISHAAILAKAAGIPMITKIPYNSRMLRHTVVMDAYEGDVIFDPSDSDIAHYEELAVMRERDKAELKSYMGKRGTMAVYSNISDTTELMEVLANDSEGIGLLRSEFLFLNGDDFPDEDLQFEIYKEVALKMQGRKVVIRTMDIGADKTPRYFRFPKEDNPQLGMRGIRVSLKYRDSFRCQLRALIRASYYGDIDILYPMVSSLIQVREVRTLVDEICNELQSEGIPYGNFRTGIMIEVPAAVIMSRELAREVDFFSIGTNDLIQYTYAVDRQNRYVSKLLEDVTPILMMIEMVAANASKSGIPVEICGELAADLRYTKTFEKMGISALSVSPKEVLKVRRAIFS